jgi:UDP-N-acetylmuramoyl-L-alanyl-D-glutamate--2,6-diaminopimelate ligase
MKFLQLLDGAEILTQSGDATVSGIEYDSRKVKPGTLFLAMRGEAADGNRYIDQAIKQGATAIVTDSSSEKPRAGVAWAQVAHGRRALARISANFYGQTVPGTVGNRLRVTGITGTNGKSTTAFLFEAILAAAGRKSLLVGTIEYHVAGQVLPAPHTTPEALELHQLFASAVKAGATEAVMEVSSHALDQQRVFGVGFDVAVFTNLSRDHLDYHKSMEQYFAAKLKLFEGCGTERPRVAVLNEDDPYGKQLQDICKSRGSRVLTYGWQSGDFHAKSVAITLQGTSFEMITPLGGVSIVSPLIGKVNVYNILAAAAAAEARECSAQEIAEGIAALEFVPGRFQRVNCGQPFTVVVDYAHTDDALRNLTALAREFVAQAGGRGRVITLFGCGGDRDRAKRPLMGEAAGRGSDLVVLSSDNPRSEDPVAIINDALVGVQRSGTKYKIEPDRQAAIALAISTAMAGDIVLLAGKGHEKTQVSRGGSLPFDDVEVARGILQASGYDGEAKASLAGKSL